MPICAQRCESVAWSRMTVPSYQIETAGVIYMLYGNVEHARRETEGCTDGARV